jgi:hypothetical protein
MVARGTDDAEGALRLARADFIDSGEDAACGTHRSSPGVFADTGVAGGKVREATVNFLLGKPQIGSSMNEFEVFSCGVARYDTLHLLDDPGRRERIHDGFEATRLLGMPVAGIVGLTQVVSD